MKSTSAALQKILTVEDLVRRILVYRLKNKKIAFTNGVFDILHEGHIASLNEAAGYADILIVAVNSDASVKRLKGPARPVNHEQARALMIANLLMTDAVVIFDEDTPLELIKKVMPDVLIKGGDYTIEQVAGAKEVMAAGGEVKIASMVPGISTTSIIEKISDDPNKKSI